ncbi:MAG: beta-ketoacyl-[acyl-carrier-protein] synthase II [Bacteroidetes bacterium]|nr:MAG: beta-ketoacyl-[acyl-carrier-protein] synthase II [Bacteroidota bacterium]
MRERRIVVTGLGALTPIGNDLPSYWEGLSKGVSGANLITNFDASKFKTQFACELKGFDPLAHFDRKEARKLDTFTQYAMVAADEALQDAGFNFEQTDRNRFGVIVGSGIGGINVFFEEVKNFVQGEFNPRFNPFFIPKMIIDIAAGQISIKHGLKGPNYSSVSACATASNCIIDAFLLIKMGYADVMLAGGTEAAVNEIGIGGFNGMRALSTNNEEYQTASRPFDATRDGFVMGEGAGMLVLEELGHAIRRGARIYAEIGGVGMSADAHHITAPCEDGEGAARVMKATLEDAGMTPSDIDYINVHGTSTPLGDVSETLAIKTVFGEHAYKLNISSTKSMTGHLLGAAGAVEAIATIFAIQHQRIPPTINFAHPDEQCDLNYTFNQAVDREVHAAISNTFGFGGHNACVLMKKFEE